MQGKESNLPRGRRACLRAGAARRSIFCGSRDFTPRGCDGRRGTDHLSGHGASPLDGRNKYVIHFKKGALPPVDEFWSVTIYDLAGFTVPTPTNRYTLGDRGNLKLNADGSLDIYLQSASPGADKESNWLPTPAQPFSLRCRIPSPRRPSSPTGPARAPPRRPAPPHLPPPHSRSPRPSPSLDAAPGTRRCPRPAAAPLRPLLDREPVAAQDGPGHRAIAALTLAFAPVTRAVPGLRLGIRRAGRMSPTRSARRGSRGRSVCPS